MSDRLMKDVSKEYEKMRAQLLLIRVILGLNPCHDPVECVRILHSDGRERFESVRGEKCDYAAQWTP